MEDRILAQIVRIAYGKVTRGAAGAAVRNRIALGQVLPDAILDGDGDRVHRATMVERLDFAPREEVSALVPRPLDGLLELLPPFTVGRAGDGLELGHDNYAGATPAMQTLLPFVVRRGDWVRIVRHRTMRSMSGARWFEDEAINIGRFARRPHPRVFAGPPPKLVDLRVGFRQPRRR